VVRIAIAYVFFACFLVWNEQRNTVIELQMLNTSVGSAYAVQFESAKGNGLMLVNHNFEGGGLYSLLQGKLTVLNFFLSEFRPALLLPTPQAH
jgi:hypothetical protein